MRSFNLALVLAVFTSSAVFAAPPNPTYSTGHHGRQLGVAGIVSGAKSLTNLGVANADQSQPQDSRRGLAVADVVSEVENKVGAANAQQSQRRDLALAGVVSEVENASNAGIANAHQSQRRSSLGKKRTDDPSQLGSYQTSVATVFVVVQQKIQPVCDSLVATVKVGVTVEVVLPIINELKDALNEALAAIEYIAANPGAGVFYYSGKVLALADVVALIVALFVTVITALSTALHNVSATEAKFLVALFVEVGELLAKVVCATFTINGGIQALLAAQLAYLTDVITYLSLTTIISWIGIPQY